MHISKISVLVDFIPIIIFDDVESLGETLYKTVFWYTLIYLM